MYRPDAQPVATLSRSRIQELLTKHKTVSDLNMRAIDLSGVELRKRNFYGCNFESLAYHGGVVVECSYELCFFPFAAISSVRFESCRFRNCVFGCADLNQISFVGSNVIQCSFNGCIANNLEFNDCDLLHTRFDAAVFSETLIENCNLKQTRFVRTDTRGVRFKYSNQEDAIFVAEETYW